MNLLAQVGLKQSWGIFRGGDGFWIYFPVSLTAFMHNGSNLALCNPHRVGHKDCAFPGAQAEVKLHRITTHMLHLIYTPTVACFTGGNLHNLFLSLEEAFAMEMIDIYNE